MLASAAQERAEHARPEVERVAVVDEKACVQAADHIRRARGDTYLIKADRWITGKTRQTGVK